MRYFVAIEMLKRMLPTTTFHTMGKLYFFFSSDYTQSRMWLGAP